MIYIVSTLLIIQIILKEFIHPGLNNEIIIELINTRLHFATIGVPDDFDKLAKSIALIQIIAFTSLASGPQLQSSKKYSKTFLSTFYIMSPGILLNSIEGLIFNNVYNTFGFGIEFSCDQQKNCGKWITIAMSLGDICLYISLIYILILIAFNQNKLTNFIDTIWKKFKPKYIQNEKL